MSENLPPRIVAALDEEVPIAVPPSPRLYTVDPATRIPVSTKTGPLWQSRIRAGKNARKDRMSSWDEALRYYNHNQQEHRTSTDNERAGNRYFSKRRNDTWSETENIVYANTRAIIPLLYAKNPQVEFTNVAAEHKEFIDRLEAVVNVIADLPNAPGIDLKKYAKQAVLAAELCNLGWLEVGYVDKMQSSDEARLQIDELATKLLEATDEHEIRRVEGELQALEESLDVLTPAGPFVKYHPPHNWVVDPDTQEPGYTDAKWMACAETYPTDYLNARYGMRDENGDVKSLYDPSHVLLAGSTGSEVQAEIDNFKLFDTNAEPNHYGYDDAAQLRRAQRTQCWRIWDKTTRRVLLYADNNWQRPIWIENDPYGLPDFFPVTAVYFNTTVIGPDARSNVTYYLDQQDALNEIHDEMRRARQDTREAVLYDSRTDRESVINFLTSNGPNAVPIQVPDGKSIKDIIFPKPNAMLSAIAFFDPARVLSTIDRVSGVSEMLRGAQLKTNTTKYAAESYNSTTATRLDEKIDAIEDAIGRVMYKVAFMCAQFMDVQTVTALIGQDRAQGWRTYSPDELRLMFSIRSIGGSTEKPNSTQKKQLAMQIAEVLSKFAQFAPKTVLMTILKLFDKAFDDLELPPDAFTSIIEEAQQAMARGNSTATTTGAASGTSDAGAPDITQLAQLVDALPPQAKQALGEILAQGVPVMEALPQVIQAANNSGTQQGL